jgi:hypothetical protein
MTTYRKSPRFPLEIIDHELDAGFRHIALVAELDDPTLVQVVGFVVDSWEVIVKVSSGYQVLRYGWTWIPRNVRPRPSEMSRPRWMMVGNTVGSIDDAMSLSHSLPIIDGPVEVIEGAKIIINTKE